MDYEALSKIDEIGDKTAYSIVSYFNNDLNKKFFKRLDDAGLKLSKGQNPNNTSQINC